MNIYILLILLVIFYIFFEKENRLVREELYGPELINYLKLIDNYLDKICSEHNLSKIYEFSIKLCENKVSNKRYTYGIGFINDKIFFNDIKKKIFNELKISKILLKEIDKYQKENLKNKNIVAFGVSKEENNSEKIYIESNNSKYDLPIVSFEYNGSKIFTRYYSYKTNMNFYLMEEMKKHGIFGKIILKYFPVHKLKNHGLKFSTTREKNILSFRILCKEYNTIEDIKNFIFEISDYFNMNNSNLIEVKKWIYNFKYNELHNIGITLYPKKSITLYCAEITNYEI